MSGDKRARLKEWLEKGEAKLLPLTFPQRELWEVAPVPPADMANHICCLINIRGGITADDCRTAVQRVVDRQEVLRVSFLPGKERPVQMVRQSGDANVRTRDLTSGEGRPEAVEAMAREIFSVPFDLVQGPLYRVEVLRRGPDDHVIVMAIHHAIADGWSLGVFVQDLCAAYVQERMGIAGGLPSLPLTYSDWGAAERDFWQPAELELRANYWRSTLSGRTQLWTDRNGATAKDGPPQRWVTSVPAAIGRPIREVARQSGATLFSTLLAAFQLALSKWTGEEDILVGTPVANRTKQSVRETMGYCSGIVPLRGTVDSSRPFAESLRATHQATVDAFGNAMPFAELVHAIGDSAAPGVNPVFQIRFALQNHPIPDVALPGLSAQLRMRSTGTSRFDLGCEITEAGEALEIVWLYWPNMFSFEEMENLSGLFGSVLAGVSAAPDSRATTLLNAL